MKSRRIELWRGNRNGWEVVVYGTRRHDGSVTLHVTRGKREVCWCPLWRNDAWYGDAAHVPAYQILEQAGLPGERKAAYEAVKARVIAEAQLLDEEDERRIEAARAEAAAVLSAKETSSVEKAWSAICALSQEQRAEILNRLLDITK